MDTLCTGVQHVLQFLELDPNVDQSPCTVNIQMCYKLLMENAWIFCGPRAGLGFVEGIINKWC
ncbi:hypothetical protein CY35_04G149000 [Sphagnum magellanicum]|nr:hypothetical protein CY35_04G149000 [Sphagnum magellanicum]